jgi:hypothetical protein
MENTDLIIATVILVIAFTVFLVSTIKEFIVMENSQFENDDELKGAASFIKILGSFFMRQKK